MSAYSKGRFKMISLSAVIVVPLHTDELGVIYVNNTQAKFETIIRAFHNGAEPEQIVQVYDELDLGDIYLVIAYYLQNIDEMDNYMDRSELESPSRSDEIQFHNPELAEVRRRLLAPQRTNKRII
jgi:uncharacterized protein (DUF433 family)